MLREIVLRSTISCFIAALLYLAFAALVARYWNRTVKRDIRRHDVVLGVTSVIFGSPILQIFGWANERWHLTMLYMNVGDKGWLWWLISIPVYLMAWDLVFYITHLWLHSALVYRKSHFRHHACRPPVPFSGIAIDPFETILSGILPYTVPLFFIPFHIYTVYAINILLVLWAALVHSSAPWYGNAVMLGTRDHNLHHFFGLKNANYGAIFTFWDRIGGTFDRATEVPWWGKESWTPTAGKPTTETPSG